MQLTPSSTKEKTMPSYQNDPIVSRVNAPTGADGDMGVYGESTLFNGVRGITYAPGHGAVVGVSENHTSQAGPGVFGESDGTGVWGHSRTWMGVYGRTESSTGGAGVMGDGDPGPGVVGVSTTWIGVYGETAGVVNGPAGVWGEHKGVGIGVKAVSKDGIGLAAYSTTSEAIHAETHSPGTASIAAYNLAPNGTGAAVYARKEGTIGHAGFFDGHVHVTRSVTVEGDVMCVNADCAEEFAISDPEVAHPGTVMVIGESGIAFPCGQPYDHRVLGVVSGAGDFRPALLLDRQGGPTRRPIALMGKVFCRVDADLGPIRPGDLLTTSSTPGHAMRAGDTMRAAGAMIGKALASLDAGKGMIPIIAMLQ
jgi:hypothetical protein